MGSLCCALSPSLSPTTRTHTSFSATLVLQSSASYFTFGLQQYMKPTFSWTPSPGAYEGKNTRGGGHNQGAGQQHHSQRRRKCKTARLEIRKERCGTAVPTRPRKKSCANRMELQLIKYEVLPFMIVETPQLILQ